MQTPNVVGPEYLVPLLRRKIVTIKADAYRKPESLPPRLLIPGSKKLLWIESDVLDWLKSCREKKDGPVAKGGRPSTLERV